MKVERRKYRFRILNASISRGFNLTLSSGEPLIGIGTDGGLMPEPQPVGSMRVGMAERYEVVIDFARYKISEKVDLKNLGLPNMVDYDSTGNVMRFEVASEAKDTTNNEVPAVLNTNTHVMGLQESQAVKTRYFRFERSNGMWTINGKIWDPDRMDANPQPTSVEIWELENKSDGWFHPIHIHLIDFKILDRNGRPPHAYEKGPKDVGYVGEGEKVRVIMRFGPQQGKYMMHGHNLVHEDHDMMMAFEVGEGGPHPSKAARRCPSLRPDRCRKKTALCRQCSRDSWFEGSLLVVRGKRHRLPSAPARAAHPTRPSGPRVSAKKPPANRVSAHFQAVFRNRLVD